MRLYLEELKEKYGNKVDVIVDRESSSTKVNIYLDDERPLPVKHFDIAVRDYDTFVEVLNYFKRNGVEVGVISFDHDLADTLTHKDGVVAVRWIMDNQYPFDLAKFHTNSPVGFRNMQMDLRSWQRSDDLAPKIVIDNRQTDSIEYRR